MRKTTARLRAAVAAHRRGDLGGAAVAYRKILKHEPRNANALHLLGLVLAESGRLDEAAAALARAIEIGGPEGLYCANLGRVFMLGERYREAVACFRQALRASPLDVGVTLQLGKCLAAAGDLEQARLAFEQTLALEPGLADAYYNLGVLAMVERDLEQACRLFQRTLELDPGCAAARNNLGILMHGARNYASASESYDAAARLSPASPDPRYNQARLLLDLDRLESALLAFSGILSGDPAHAEARTGLANCLLRMGRPGEAIGHYRQAIAGVPESTEAHFNLALALLQTGNFEEGWREYEWRLRQWPDLARTFAQPRWDGSPLGGRRILLHSEQGMGDTLQFGRYASAVKDRGGYVILECQPPLVRLLHGLRGVDEVVARGGRLPWFDVHAPLLSLPWILGPGWRAEPPVSPYIGLDSRLVEEWCRRLNGYRRRRIGVVWAGNPCHLNDSNRSLPPEYLSMLSRIRDHGSLLNLQTGPAALAQPEPEMVPLGALLTDFAETAAAMRSMDLVISVDTASAHLAGALAIPTWTLLPFAADWRWRDSGDRTPWYPSMRLFRQQVPRDWNGVLESVVGELEQTSGA